MEKVEKVCCMTAFLKNKAGASLQFSLAVEHLDAAETFKLWMREQGISRAACPVLGRLGAALVRTAPVDMTDPWDVRAELLWSIETALDMMFAADDGALPYIEHYRPLDVEEPVFFVEAKHPRHLCEVSLRWAAGVGDFRFQLGRNVVYLRNDDSPEDFASLARLMIACAADDYTEAVKEVWPADKQEDAMVACRAVRDMVRKWSEPTLVDRADTWFAAFGRRLATFVSGGK